MELLETLTNNLEHLLATALMFIMIVPATIGGLTMLVFQWFEF